MADVDFSQYVLGYNKFHQAIGNHNPLIQPFELGLEFFGSSVLVQFLCVADNDWSHGGIIRQIVPHRLFLPSNYSEQFLTLASEKIELNRIQPFKVVPYQGYQLRFEPSAYIDKFTLRIWQYTGEKDPFFSDSEALEIPTLEELGGINLDRLGVPGGVATLGEDGILLESQRPAVPEPEQPSGGGGGGGVVLDSGWLDLQLQNNYVAYARDSGGLMQLPQIRKIGNLVRMQGAVKNGDNERVVTILPEGFRPTRRHVFAEQSGGGVGQIQVWDDGRVIPYAPNTNGFLALEATWLTGDPIQEYTPVTTGITQNFAGIARHWRVRNLESATGGDAQWIVYELAFGNESFPDLCYNGNAYANLGIINCNLAFNKNSGDFWTGNGRYSVNGWLSYTFPTAVRINRVDIRNLNNGSNVPPMHYAVDASLDGENWREVWQFLTGTNDGQIYNSVKP